MQLHGSTKTDELTDYEEIAIHDRQDKVIARGWLGVRKDSIGAVLRTSRLRVRVGNILIGDEKLLDHCFGGGTNDRFNGYLIGEIHVTATELIPNGRRDGFQDSEMKNDFRLGVEKFAIPLIKTMRQKSEQKNSIKPIEEAKQTIISVKKKLNDGFVGDAAKKETLTEVRDGIQVLTDIQKRRNLPDTAKEEAESASEKLHTLFGEIKEARPSIDGALEGSSFSKREKELIRSVLEAVYELYEKAENRDELIKRVQQKLKRAHR